MLHVRLHHYEQAIADYNEALKLDPKKLAVWLNRAGAHFTLRHYEQAIADYEEAIRLEPRQAKGYGCLAQLLTTAVDPKYRDPARALEMARKATELAPEEAPHWTTLGMAQLRAGDWQATVAALDEAMKRSQGGDASDWFVLAMARWQMGKKQEARTWYDRAVAWMEKNKDALDKLQADVLGVLGDDAAALLEITKR
jgi:tetratricopeptide (TPR) repeat protein